MDSLLLGNGPQRRLRQMRSALSTRRRLETPATLPAHTGGGMRIPPEGPTAEETFLFDMQGFLLLRGVLSLGAVAALRARLLELEAADYPDEWMDEMGLDRAAIRPTKATSSRDFEGADGVTQLNGLPRIDQTGLFDTLVAHPHVLPYLDAFIGDPQLVNTWSLSKHTSMAKKGGWHGGLEPRGYAVDSSGNVRTQMLNVVWSLSDNGIHDGCMTVMPGRRAEQTSKTSFATLISCSDRHGVQVRTSPTSPSPTRRTSSPQTCRAHSPY
jgi:hypothetical protein